MSGVDHAASRSTTKRFSDRIDRETKDVSYGFFQVATPAALFCAAGVAYRDPSLGPFLFFLLGGLAFLFFEDIIRSSKRTMVRHISDGVTLSLIEFVENSDQSEAFISALGETIRIALTNENFTTTFKTIAIESMRDERLQSDILDTCSGAIVRASQDSGFNKVLLSAFSQGISDAISDKEFMDAIFKSLVGAMVAASQNDELRMAVLNVTTEGVSTAVRDERFMDELKSAMKECLSDGELFRAGATGLWGAVLPGRAASQSKKLGAEEGGKAAEK